MAQYIYLRNGQTKIIPGTKGGLRSRVAVVNHFIVYQKETALNVWADCGGHGDPDNAIVTGGRCRMGVRGSNWCIDIELTSTGFTGTESPDGITGDWKCVHEIEYNWVKFWELQPDVLFFGEVSKITDNKLYNQKTGATDYLTVGGSVGTYTFECPNTAPYIAADTDFIWFKTDESQRTTTEAELIGYDFTRTIVKYEDESDYSIEAIMILSSNIDTAKMRNNFHLSVWWSNVLSAYGNVKGNRGIGQSVWTAEPGYEAELVTYKTGLATPLSAGELTLLNDLIVGLKTDLGSTNLSDDFDVIRIMAGETSEVSLKNLVKDEHHATLEGASVPTFITKEGFTGTGSGYIDTQYNPVADGENYTNNNCSFGLYFRSGDAAGSTVSAAGINDTTAGKIIMYLSDNENFDRAWLNSDSFESINLTFAAGFKILTRTNDTVAHYINGVGGTGIETMHMFGSGNAFVLSRNILGTGAGTNFSLAQVSIEMWGRYFTLTEHEKIRARFETYMDAHGKGVVA